MIVSPGHAGGAPLGPVGRVVAGAALVECPPVQEGEHAPPRGRVRCLQSRDEALLLDTELPPHDAVILIKEISLDSLKQDSFYCLILSNTAYLVHCLV